MAGAPRKGCRKWSALRRREMNPTNRAARILPPVCPSQEGDEYAIPPTDNMPNCLPFAGGDESTYMTERPPSL